jgi:hypothetical protein
MAKQDLYKTAQHSAKLFKLIREGEDLEPWVQAKITKAAADIESVYQYMNFEKHFKDQEKEIMSNTSLSESTRTELRNKLFEAKAKVAELKKKAMKEKAEKMEENEMKVGQTKKTRTGELTKTDTGVVHKNTSYHDDGDEIASNAKSGKGIKSHAKAQSAAEKKEKAPAQKMSPKSAKTWGMSNSEKFDNRDKVDEAKKKSGHIPDRGYDGDLEEPYPTKSKPHPPGHLNKLLRKKLGEPEKEVNEAKAKCCCEEKGKTKCPVHGKMDEARTMSKAAKGVMKYGKDGMQALAKAGKEGKSLDKVRNKFDKYDESKELKGGQKKLDKNHNGKLDKKDFELLRNKKNIKEAIARAQIALDEGKKKSAGKKPAWLEKAEVEAEEKSGKKVSKAEEKKVGIVKESTEFDRMKTLMTRLNG